MHDHASCACLPGDASLPASGGQAPSTCPHNCEISLSDQRFFLDLFQGRAVGHCPWGPRLRAEFQVRSHILFVQANKNVTISVVKCPGDLAQDSLSNTCSFHTLCCRLHVTAHSNTMSRSSSVLSSMRPPMENWWLGLFLPMCMTLHFLEVKKSY